MSEHTIDLLSIPIYQQMARIVYVDRCMVKWAGMLLSELADERARKQKRWGSLIFLVFPAGVHCAST